MFPPVFYGINPVLRESVRSLPHREYGSLYPHTTEHPVLLRLL